MAGTEKEIYSITEANKALSESYGTLSNAFMLAASKSKAWDFVSRMTSGSGFWKIQNKIRAITTAYAGMNEAMAKSIERQTEASKTMKKLQDAKDKLGAMRTGEDGGFSIDKMKETDEYKSQIDAYKGVFGDKAGEDKLLDVITEQLEANETMFAELQGTQEDAIYYQSLGWRLDKKMAFKSKKYMKAATNVLKMAGRFLLKASLGFLLLILFIPLAIKLGKSLKENLGLGMDDIKKFLKFIKAYIKFMLELLKAAFSGDIKKVLGLLRDRVLVPIFEKVASLLGKVRDKMISLIMNSGPVKAIINIKNKFLELLEAIKNLNPKKAIANKVNKVKGFFGLAGGGTIKSGGMAIVGEDGPELVSLPSGATVHSNTQSRNMGNTIHVHVNGRVGASDAEIRDIAQKVAREIGLQMNRTTSAVGRF